MQRLFLVRHGPTHAKGMIGWTDLPADLSDTAALSRLSAYLPSDARIVSSDLIRAVDTADAIQGPCARSPNNPALREMHFGRWENLTFKNLPPEDAAHAKAFYENPGDLAPPSGESWNAVCARVNNAINQALLESTTDLIVVCHFGVILTQLQRATGLSAYDTFAQKIDNLSVTEVIIENGNLRAGIINHCP